LIGLNRRKFFEPEPHYLKYFENPKLFGDAVFSSFPSATDDIAEAGTCLALERSTACVMHSMRATEVALRALVRVHDKVSLSHFHRSLYRSTQQPHLRAKRETKYRPLPTLLLHHQSHRQPRFLLKHFVKRPVHRRNHCSLRTVMCNRYPQVSPRFNSSASPKRYAIHLFAAARALHPRITIVPFQLVTSHPSDRCEQPSAGPTCSLVSTRPCARKSGTYPILEIALLCEISDVSHTRVHEALPKHCSIDRPVRFNLAGVWSIPRSWN
jgi:hypothetical protein